MSSVLVCKLGAAGRAAAAAAAPSESIESSRELDAVLTRMRSESHVVLAQNSPVNAALLRRGTTLTYVRASLGATDEHGHNYHNNNNVSGFALERRGARAFRATREIGADSLATTAWPLGDDASFDSVHAAVDSQGATLVGVAAARLVFVRLGVVGGGSDDDGGLRIDVSARCELAAGATFVRFGAARGTALVELDASLLLLVPGCSSSDLLRRVVLYDGAAAAERLCALNGWSLAALHEQALELGLLHRQLDIFTPTLRAMCAEQQERVAVPLALKYLADVERTRADPEFALRLVSETMQVLSVRINSLLQAGESVLSERVAALAAALRTLRKAQRQALAIAADMSRVGGTAATSRGAAANARSGAGEAPGAHDAAVAAAMRVLDELPMPALSAAAGADSTSYRVAAARQRTPERSAWPAVVADVCRSAFDAFVANEDARAVSLLNRLGVDVREHAAALAMYVPRASLRERLLSLAPHIKWNQAEREALAWLAELTALGQSANVCDAEFAALYSALASQRKPLRAPNAPPRHGMSLPAARSLGGRVGVSAAWLAYESTRVERERVLLDTGVESPGFVSLESRAEFARDRARFEELAVLLGGAAASEAESLAALFDLVAWEARDQPTDKRAPLILAAVQQAASDALATTHRRVFVPRNEPQALDAALQTLARTDALFADDGVDLGPEFHEHALATLMSCGSSAGALMYAATHRLHDVGAFSFAEAAHVDQWRLVCATARVINDSGALGDFAVAGARLLSGEPDVPGLVATLAQKHMPLAALAVAYLAAGVGSCDGVLAALQQQLAASPTLAYALRLHAAPTVLATTLASARGDLTFASLVPPLAGAPRVRAHTDAPDVALSLGAGLAAGAVARLLASRTRAACDGAECERRAALALARYAAMNALDSDVVVGAALAFSEWLGGADVAQLLRVDVVAARRIVQWRRASGDDAEPRRVVHLFLQFGDALAPAAELHDSNKPTSPVFRALRMLEDATLALTLSPAASAARTAGQSLWSLVTSFCHVHALPLSTGHLCELAQANDWVSLLHEAQTQHFPLWQVRDIVRRHVASPAVRAHILCALRDSASARVDDKVASDVDDDGEDDAHESDDKLISARPLPSPDALEDDHVVFDALLRALDADGDKGETLLAHALQSSSTTLAVLAACFAGDVRVLDCVVVFLFAAQSKLLSARLDRIEIPSSVAQLEQCVSALLCADDAAVDSVHDALTLLCPQCPLLRYVQFHRAVRVSRPEIAQPALAAFAALLPRAARPNGDNDDDESSAALEQLSAWQQRVAQAAALALLASLSNEEERAHALQLLATAGLAPVFATLRDAVDVVRECGVAVPWAELSGATPELAVKRVARERQLAPARRLARCFGLHALADRIACREADRLLRSLAGKRAALSCIVVARGASHEQQPADASTPVRGASGAVQQLMPFMSTSKAESGASPLARAASTRTMTGVAIEPLAAEPAVESGAAWQWQRCSELLVACGCAASVAGDWFLEKVTPQTPRPEQLWLLREALSWFKGERCESDRQAAQKPRQLVSQLEMRVMFLQDDLSGEGAESSEPVAAGASRVPRALSAVVGRLLQRGDVSQARALCRQYQYESVDVQLVEVARRYALGTPAAIVAASLPPAAQELIDAHNARAALLGGVPADTSLSGAAVATRASDESCTIANASLDSHRSMVITILAQGCAAAGARMACAQARARCDVAAALNAPSEAIAARDPLDVLNMLVRAGRVRLPLAEAWVACHTLDPERTAQLLARAYIAAHRHFNPRSRAAPASPDSPAPALDADDGASPKKPVASGSKLASVRRALFGRRTDGDSTAAVAANKPAPRALGLSESADADELIAQSAPKAAAVAAAASPSARSARAAPSTTDDVTSAAAAAAASVRHRAVPALDEEVPGGGIERHWTTEEFATFARLCAEPSLVGRLLEAELSRFSEPNAEVDSAEVGDDAAHAAMQAALAARLGAPDRQLSYACECELLVAAYRCFDIAGDAEAAASLLARMRERAPLFARAGEHRLLVRLYTGARAYAQMRWLLDLLVRFDRFELILGKRVAVEADRERLCASLESYLRQQLGRVRGASEIAAVERLQQMLYLRFSMWHSVGRALEARADALINDVCDAVSVASGATGSGEAADGAERRGSRLRRSGAGESSAAAGGAAASDAVLGVFGAANEQRLLGAMRTLLDAADHYTRANFPGAARRCVARVVLLGAQLREPSTRLIGLPLGDARRLMTHHGAFDATLAVARGYGLDDTAAWVRATYQQVVVRGNMPFMTRMIVRGMRPRVLTADIVAMYRSELSIGGNQAPNSGGKTKELPAIASASRRGNMQAFLRAALDDAVELFDWCEQLGFTEMATYVRQSRALQFLRPPNAAKASE